MSYSSQKVHRTPDRLTNLILIDERYTTVKSVDRFVCLPFEIISELPVLQSPLSRATCAAVLTCEMLVLVATIHCQQETSGSGRFHYHCLPFPDSHISTSSFLDTTPVATTDLQFHSVRSFVRSPSSFDGLGLHCCHCCLLLVGDDLASTFSHPAIAKKGVQPTHHHQARRDGQ